MGDNTSRGMNTILSRQAPAAEEKPVPLRHAAEKPGDDEEVEQRRNYTAARGTRERVQSVEFELLPAKGAWPSLEYAFLKETWWTPGDQRQVIVLAFTTDTKVTITGWGLRRMYELLRQHRVIAVREDGDDPVRMKAAQVERAESWIQSIDVEKPEEEE